ncbi:ATP-binding protein [Paraflavisolibacter sp. H34]|uniref:sensor histidine kinase n=1 Tax=Huijunlia imazamoxiresistens TaxID=3127457 RepID=UPI003019691A
MPPVYPTSLIRIFSWVIIAIAVIVLIGWQFDIVVFKSILPSYVPMNPSTAMCFMALSSWQLLYLHQLRSPGRLVKGIMLALLIFVLLISGLRLLDILTGREHQAKDLVHGLQQRYGLISPITAFLFVTLSLALGMNAWLKRIRNLILLFITPVFLLSFISFFGYLIGNNDLLTIKPFRPMALHTTVCFMAIAAALVLLFPKNIVTQMLLSQDSGGYVFRRLLFYIVVVPLVLGLLSYHGEQLGLYDPGFESAITVVGLLFTFLVVALQLSRRLSFTDQQRRAAENQVSQHAEEVEAANRQLEVRNRELEQFTFVSNHDLQEPLRKILLFAEMIKADHRDRLPEATERKLKKIESAAQHMRTVLGNVLEFVNLQEGEPFTFVDLNHVFAAVQTALEEVIREKGAHIQADALPRITAAPSQMHQLFYHLLSNALKFSKDGQPPRVRITCKLLVAAEALQQEGVDPNKKHYEIAFLDEGIGFEPEAANKIFVMFQRLHGRETYPGTGIGLAVCKKVVQHHNGRIWAESKPGDGAAFRILLPADP